MIIKNKNDFTIVIVDGNNIDNDIGNNDNKIGNNSSSNNIVCNNRR